MDPSSQYPIRRLDAGRLVAAADEVVTEDRVELDVNDGRLRVGLLCLPGDLEALAVGFLAGEGALRRPEDLETVEVTSGPPERKVVVRGEFEDEDLENIQQRWTRGTGCGGGGTSQLSRAQRRLAAGAGFVIQPEEVLRLIRRFLKRGGLWQRTGGVHACALADGERIVFFAEDIGRHNAFDKVIGKAFLGGVDIADKLVLTTGRLSAEIVTKALACGASVLVSRGAVTSLAVALARRFGLTLVGFARGRRLNVYTGFERIVQADEASR